MKNSLCSVLLHPNPPLLLCCLQCIESTKHGCVGNTDCCDLNVCQKETLLNATGTCLSVRRAGSSSDSARLRQRCQGVLQLNL